MTLYDDIKARADLHALAERLGLDRPGGRGNYRSPAHHDKNPSLQIKDRSWRDYSTGEGGSAIDLVMYVRGCSLDEATRDLADWLGIERAQPAAPREKSKVEWIADKCLGQAERVIEYLAGRGIDRQVIAAGIKAGALGFNDWTSPTVPAGEFGHGGEAAAYVVRSLNPGRVVAVDMRYLDPASNGGVKTQTQGDKAGMPWTSDLRRLQSARTVYVVESAINALSVESAIASRAVAAVATRGTATVELIDWRFLAGKKVLIAMDNDAPFPPEHKTLAGIRPGLKAAWALHELLTARNIAAQLVDAWEWEENDLNDILQAHGAEELARRLRRIEEWVIPGMPGKLPTDHEKARVYLPWHDFASYWRFRVREDFTSVVEVASKDEEGKEQLRYLDCCGFRVAGISRVTVASPISTLSGERDAAPTVYFSISVQTPRHGPALLRRVIDDDKLHSVDQWAKFGPIWDKARFSRLINILERTAHVGERHAANLVGLGWLDGKPVVNEGSDCYFPEPQKQCIYHNLVFPSGTPADGRRVLRAFAGTFGRNAATIALVWGLGAHLKAFLGFWPHLVMQANKGAGKSTLIKRMESAIAFTMLGGQSVNTEWRILTSVSYTTHPVGWEEISARRQEIIDRAVAMLQECYQYAPTQRGSENRMYLQCAPVLLAGEDVPVRSLIGKLVRTDLVEKGPLLPDDLPRFPVRQWLEFLAGMTRAQVLAASRAAAERARAASRASGADDNANRMADNYGAILGAWMLLCEFLELDPAEGSFESDLLTQMNGHIAESSADRAPWVWIVEIILSEISAGSYRHPYKFDTVDTPQGREFCLLIRTSHMMDHIAHTSALRLKWDNLPVKSDRVLKRQLRGAGVIASDDEERIIGSGGYAKRVCHMVALSLDKLATWGLYPTIPQD